VTEYVCITLASKPGETAAAFQTRLYAFWTHVLRTKPDDYEMVYAEASRFETENDCVTRQYFVAADGIPKIVAELLAQGVDFQPIDANDLYSKYEATSPDWFQIEH
jgi:hypothetical protein